MEDLWVSIKKFCYGFNKMQYKIISPVVLLILVFLVVRWASRPQGAVWELQDEIQFSRLDDLEIKKYIDAMTDARSDTCKNAKYKESDPKLTVSIVLDFHEHQFYDLKMTLESILRFTPDELYQEIIILDDGSAKESVRKDAIKHLAQDKFKKVKAFRSEQNHGSTISRFKGSKVATGDILIFLSSEVTVNEGWIEPLIDTVAANREAAVVPHLDSLLSGYRLFATPDNLVSVFDWQLNTQWFESREDGDIITSPVMTSSAFAIDRKFLDNIGSFDEGMDHGGGQTLELSFRIQLCGGSIKLARCSRVAVRNALRPHEVTTPHNFRRIAELWLDTYKHHAYSQAGQMYDPDEAERQSFRYRQNYLKKTAYSECRPFRDYKTSIAQNILVPPSDARYFGKLKAKSGYCINTDGAADRMKMVHCRPHMYEPNLVITLNHQGHLKSTVGNCMELGAQNALMWTDCKDAKEQKWQFHEGVIHNSGSTDLCLIHKTDETGHFLDVTRCTKEDRLQIWTFLKY